MDVGTFTDPNNHIDQGFYHVITGCLSKGRQPRQTDMGAMSCDNHGATLKVVIFCFINHKTISYLLKMFFLNTSFHIRLIWILKLALKH